MVESARTKRKAYNRLFKFFKLVLRDELKTSIVADDGKLFKVKSRENTINGLVKIAMAGTVCQCSDQHIA